VRNKSQTRQAEEALEEHVRNIAAFPLAIPLMAGPGAITATLLLAGQAAARPLWLGVLFGVVVAVMAACMLAFLVANRIDKLLGVTGNAVLSRLLGVILAALAVQFVIDGLRAALAG
jgi:multiple antibiotic resistance protein